MVMLDWWEANLQMKELLKCIMVNYGVLLKKTVGDYLKQLLSASRLDSKEQTVCNF